MKINYGFELDEQPVAPHPAAQAYSDRALQLSAQPMPDVMAYRDIAFGPDRWQRFDVFAPRVADAARPVLVFLHGGGWVTGYKEWCGFMAPGVIAAGAILVTPTHRLAPDHKFPVFLEDVMDAFAAIRSRIAEFGGNGHRMFIAGHSAGGHIAMLASLRADLWQGRMKGLCGVLPISATLDLHQPNPAPGSLEAAVYRDVLLEATDDRAASPISFADRLKFPLDLAWGECDTDRVLRSNAEMVRRLEQSGKTFSTWVRPRTDHFQMHLALADREDPWFGRLRAMIGQAT